MRKFIMRGYHIRLGNGQDIKVMRHLIEAMAQGRPPSKRQRKLWDRIKGEMQQARENACDASALLGARHFDGDNCPFYKFWENGCERKAYC